MMLIVPQLLMFTGCGATKSLNSAGNDDDERLFRNVLPNASHVPGREDAGRRQVDCSLTEQPCGQGAAGDRLGDRAGVDGALGESGCR